MKGSARVRVAKLADTASHVASPFLQTSRPSPVASRRDIATAHARLWLADERADPSDFEPKTTSLLGMQVSFFNWDILHFLFDEIYVRSRYAFASPRTPQRIIDAGANIGLASLWFARAFPEARITSIEPDPQTFALLQVNLERNGLTRVTPVAAAVGASPGSVELIINPDRPGDLRMSTDARRFGTVPVTVPAVRLSDFVDGPVDLLKLDVEGAEHGVLDEMVASGALSQIGAIAMEYHHHIDPDVDRLGDFLRTLEDQGFSYRVEAAGSSKPMSAKSVRAFQDITLLAVRRST